MFVTVSQNHKNLLRTAIRTISWLREYIELNTNFRILANNEFEKNLSHSLNSFLYHLFVSALSLSITINPYFGCQQFAEILVRHIGIYMVIVYMFQIGAILFDQQICNDFKYTYTFKAYPIRCTTLLPPFSYR